MRIALNNKDFYIEEYDFDTDFLNCLLKEPNAIQTIDMYTYNSDYSTDTILTNFRCGWEKPLPKIKEAISVSMNHFTKGDYKRSKLVNSVVGCRPNVPNYCMKLPLTMYKNVVDYKKQPVISIYYDFGVSANIEAGQKEEKSAKVLAKICELEKRGYRVRLNAVFCSRQCFSNRKYVGFYFPLKNESQLLDLKRVSFPIISTDMLRVLTFAYLDMLDARNNQLGTFDKVGKGYAIGRDDYSIRYFLSNIKRPNERCYYLSYYTDLDKVFNDL